MKYQIINISELNSFNYSVCTNNGVQVCNASNVRLSVDGSKFIINGENIEGYTLEEITSIIKTIEWNTSASNFVVASININVVNNTSTATILENQMFTNVKSIDYINEFNSYSALFGELNNIVVNKVDVNFSGVQTITLNDSVVIECQLLEPTLFNELVVVFNLIKQNIIDQLCA